MARLNTANNAESKLTVAVGKADTTLTVEDASIFSTTPFLLTIKDEIVEVTSVSASTLTVARAQEGTMAGSYVVGAEVKNMMTAGSYNELATGASVVAVSDEVAVHEADDATLTNSAHVRHGTFTTTLDTVWAGTSAPFTKAQTVMGILAADTPILDVVMSGTFATDDLIIDTWGLVYRAVTTANVITFYATKKPIVSLPLQIKVVR